MPTCTNLKHLSFGFWLNTVDAGITYGIALTSIVIGTEELIARFGFDESRAAQVVVIPYLVIAIFMPILGWWCDKYGHRLTLSFLCAILIFIGHFSYLFLTDCN